MEQQATFKDYNETLKQDKLLGIKCKSCGAVTVPPKMACRQCASPDVETVTLEGNGKIRTFTTVFVASEGREAEVPYILVMVELDSGSWVMGNLKGVDPAQATTGIIGKKVKMGHEVFPGDKFSAGESARPVFTLVS